LKRRAEVMRNQQPGAKLKKMRNMKGRTLVVVKNNHKGKISEKSRRTIRKK
jgi:hypothetical protein